jgi:hypothetical protein
VRTRPSLTSRPPELEPRAVAQARSVALGGSVPALPSPAHSRLGTKPARRSRSRIPPRRLPDKRRGHARFISPGSWDATSRAVRRCVAPHWGRCRRQLLSARLQPKRLSDVSAGSPRGPNLLHPVISPTMIP